MELKNIKCKQNRIGTLHGGVIASLVDVAGSMAISAKSRSTFTGVSVDLNVSYIKAVKIGETIEVVAKCDKIGKTLGFTSIEVFVNSENQKILAATGRHTKFIGRKP